MIRNVNHPFSEIAEHWIKILRASVHEHDHIPVWIIKLTVGKGQSEVDGWVFAEPQNMELRFETYPEMAPPGFLSGRYLSQDVNESSLALLFDSPCEEDLAHIESCIRSFINKSKFCVRTLTDITTETCRQEATSYRYGCAAIPIRKERRCNVLPR
jgi:hypothetical protein